MIACRVWTLDCNTKNVSNENSTEKCLVLTRASIPGQRVQDPELAVLDDHGDHSTKSAPYEMPRCFRVDAPTSGFNSPDFV